MITRNLPAAGAEAQDRVKAALAAHFDVDSNFPDEHVDGEYFFPDGSRSVVCTNWMIYARRLLGDRVEFYGYLNEKNPGACAAPLGSGHDFAIVDNRYIVDGWVKHVTCVSDRSVFDMRDPRDQPIVKDLYGDPFSWKRNELNTIDGRNLKVAIDSESAEFRMRAMRGFKAFDDAIVPEVEAPAAPAI